MERGAGSSGNPGTGKPTKGINWYWLFLNTFIPHHSCPILSNRFHPTKQHSICCRSENCVSLARSGQSAVESIDSFDLSNGKVYYRFDKWGRRSDSCISLVTMATRPKIVESIDSFDRWEWLVHSRSTLKVCRTDGYTWMTTNKYTFLVLKTQKGVEQFVEPTDKRRQKMNKHNLIHSSF